MGLDMYLTAERYYMGEKYFNDPAGVRIFDAAVADVPEGYTVKAVRVEAAYWRKANQIHAWFVDNVQNGEDECRPHYVEREKLQELIDLCKRAIETKDASLLTPRGGFFFGSTEIDEYYWDDLQNTIDQLFKALRSFDEKDWTFEYCSCW